MVDRPPQQLEWEECSSSESGLGNGDRHFQVGVGCHLQRNQNRRFLVSAGKRIAHQLLRTPGQGVCGEVICEGDVQCSCTIKNGQPDSGSLHEQDERDSLPTSNGTILPTMEVVSEQRHNSICRVSSGPREFGNKRGVIIHRPSGSSIRMSSSWSNKL